MTTRKEITRLVDKAWQRAQQDAGTPRDSKFKQGERFVLTVMYQAIIDNDTLLLRALAGEAAEHLED